MTEFFTRIRSALTFCLSLVYLSNLFIKSDFINDLSLVLMLIVIVLSLTVVTGTSRVIGYASFALSIFLFLLYHAPVDVWKQAFLENLYLVVLFTMVPLLSIPIKYGGYFAALQGVFRRYVNTNSRFYLLVSFISAFVGVLVNLAVVPLVYQIAKASDISQNKRLLSSAISRGFTTCTIWAPTTAAIALVVQLTGAKWSLFFPYGILCGVIAGLVGYLMTIFEEKRSGTIFLDEAGNPDIKLNSHKVIELSAFSIVLIISIPIVSQLTGIQAIIVVSMASLIFPVIWLGLIGRLSVLLKELQESYFKESLPRLKNEIILFIGAGVFATSITYSHLGNYVPKILSLLVDHNALLLAIIVIYGNVILSALGIHPIIPVTIIGGTVKAAVYGVSPTYMAVILAISWAMGITVSPSSATVIAISGLAGQSPVQVGLRWNGLYVLRASVIMIIVITVFRMLGLL